MKGYRWVLKPCSRSRHNPIRKKMGVKLVNNIPRIRQELKVQVAKGINSAAQYAVGEARDLTPVDTGFLKAHIGQTVTATPDSLHAEIRSLARYSGHVNYGTHKQSPQPFWTVALLMMRQKFHYLLKSGFVSIGRVGSAGGNVIRAAEQEFHGPFGRKGAGF